MHYKMYVFSSQSRGAIIPYLINTLLLLYLEHNKICISLEKVGANTSSIPSHLFVNGEADCLLPYWRGPQATPIWEAVLRCS